MSALTKNERDGLDDVFLSIHSRTEKYEKLKEVSSLIFSNQTKQEFTKLLKDAKIGLKESKVSKFILDLTKKKKNLSK